MVNNGKTTVPGPWDRLVSNHSEELAWTRQRREDVAPLADPHGRMLGLADIDGGTKNEERRRLRQLSLGPTLGLLVDTLARQLLCDGVSRSGLTGDPEDDTEDLHTMWEPWEYAGLPTKQTALYRESLIDGVAYVVALPGRPQPRLLPLPSSRVACGWGGDPSAEWPTEAALLDGAGTPWLYIDDTSVIDPKTGEITATHPAGVCPVVRFAPYQDLAGACPGLVDRLRPAARRYVKTVNDRLLVQHNNSWRVRTATGLADPGSPEEAERQKAILEHADILTGGEGVQFGSLPETTMSSLLDAERADLGTLAALASVPSWALSGSQLVNLSADALAEAKSAERTHVGAIQRSYGRSVASLLRLAQAQAGRRDLAADYSLRIDWRDMEARSLSQAADALGKLTQSLGVPAELLWQRIPGVSPQEADEWRKWAEQHPDALTQYAQALTPEQGEGTDNPLKA